MHCPVCKDAALVMSERQGVEIDYCPKCRGIWLDRGELDKILERASQDASARPSAPAPEPSPYAQGAPYRQETGHGYGSQKPYKKKSFLEELFD